MISIVLCTYNGAERLPFLLDSFSKLEGLGEIAFELLAVDNASTDGTADLLRSFCLSRPWIRYLREDNKGINFARNRGILEAKGDVLVFIDDDITFGSKWLSSYHLLFSTDQEAVVAGGRVICVLPEKVPAWLAAHGQFSFPYITFSVEHGNNESTIDFQSGMPVGPNMAFRRRVFDSFGLFRTDLGLKGKLLMPGAEYEYFLRLRKEKLSWRYLPDALIYHPLKESQISKSYFLKRTFGVGRVAAKTMELLGKPKRLGPVPLFCFRILAESVGRYLTSAFSRDARKRFYLKAQVYKSAGLMYEWINPRND